MAAEKSARQPISVGDVVLVGDSEALEAKDLDWRTNPKVRKSLVISVGDLEAALAQHATSLRVYTDRNIRRAPRIYPGEKILVARLIKEDPGTDVTGAIAEIQGHAESDIAKIRFRSYLDEANFGLTCWCGKPIRCPDHPWG